jgi:diguanylate cyclase (GGDEF)-like protein
MKRLAETRRYCIPANKVRSFTCRVAGTDRKWSMAWRNLNRKIRARYIELLTISAVKNTAGDVRHYVGIFSDITMQKEHEQRLKNWHHFDTLTGLPNRALLNDRLAMSIAMATRNKTLLALAVLDLDGFKAVNDNYGHAAGDQLLIEFAQRAQVVLRDTDTLSRLGGDEFVILLNDLDTLEQAWKSLPRTRTASQSYEIGATR